MYDERIRILLKMYGITEIRLCFKVRLKFIIWEVEKSVVS